MGCQRGTRARIEVSSYAAGNSQHQWGRRLHRLVRCNYGRGAGVGRGRGVGSHLPVHGVGVGVGVGVDVAVGVAVGVAVAVGVGVGVGVDVGAPTQYLPPVFNTSLLLSAPPQMIISLPVQTAV